jgi:hypothetical protein
MENPAFLVCGIDADVVGASYDQSIPVFFSFYYRCSSVVDSHE